MDRKIKVLCVPSDTGGCGLHRSLVPHQKLAELFSEDFDVTIEYKPNWRDLDMLNTFDILHFHKGLYQDMEGFYSALNFCRDNNIITIMDIDDYWDVGQFHPHYLMYKNSTMSQIIRGNLSRVDYVTTTTPIFAQKIMSFNPNVKVFVNALCPHQMEQMKTNTRNPNRIRFGFVMGSSHEHDMELVKGLTNKLSKDVLNKVQFVLCGYDLRGSITEYKPDGTKTTRDIKPLESVWYRFEKNITDNYNIVSPLYKDFLLKFFPNLDFPMSNNESYRRCWTRSVDNYDYMKHYNEIDVLMVPLQSTKFNENKSELKFVEAGMMNVAVIASDFGPYTIGSKNFFERGGSINENGNCVLIDNKKAHKDWCKAIEKLVKNPHYITKLQENMHKHILENYDINKITADRAEWYKSIVKKND